MAHEMHQVALETGSVETSPASKLCLTKTDGLVVGLFTVLYALRVTHPAVTRPFWIDELYTYYIVTMPDWAGMMDLIQRGPDQNPPLFYTVTRLVVGLCGESEAAFRLPAMIGYWVFCVALYAWVRLLGAKQTTALVAMTTPMFTGTVYYASEARPYGLMLGCFGVALVCYLLGHTFAHEPASYRRALLCLGASLSLATAFHYLALLPIGCLWVTEAYRTWHTRRWRWAIWVALLTPLAVWAYNWPIIAEQSKLPYWKLTLYWSELFYFYSWLLGTRTSPDFLGKPPGFSGVCQAWPPHAWFGFVFFAVIGVVMFLAWWRHRVTHKPAPSSSRLEHAEWMVLGLVLTVALPVGWMLLMKMTGKIMFVFRYLLPAAGGLAILLAFGIWHLATGSARILTASIWMLLATTTLWVSLRPWQLVRPSVEEIVGLPNPTQPVILNTQHFLPIKHYYRDQLPQVVYLFGIMTYPQPEDPRYGLRALLDNPRTPRFENAVYFLAKNKNFYVVCHKVSDILLIQTLEERQMPVIRETAEYVVYDVHIPD